jgi:citrate lyase subunit beta/citryl-CoA lyase
MNKRFRRRSLLYTPGSSSKMLDKSVDLNADSVLVDLEDAVSIPEKDAAREAIAEFIPRIQAAGKEAIIRVNAMHTFFGVKDLIAIAEMKPDAIILPKADVLSVRMADQILSGLEEHQIPKAAYILFLAGNGGWHQDAATLRSIS